MARLTIEDCAKIVPNRFELVILVLQRALALYSGSKSLVDRDDKEVVLAIREIASGKIDVETLRRAIVNKYRKDVIHSIATTKDNFFTAEDLDFSLDSQFNSKKTTNANANIDLDTLAFAGQDVDVED